MRLSYFDIMRKKDDTKLWFVFTYRHGGSERVEASQASLSEPWPSEKLLKHPPYPAVFISHFSSTIILGLTLTSAS